MGKNSQTFNYVFYTLKNSYTFSFQSTNEGKQGFLSQWHKSTESSSERDKDCFRTRRYKDAGRWTMSTGHRAA